MMFAFPIIFLVLVCGFMLGYYQYAKTALVWHVFDRTENLAAHTAVAGAGTSIIGVIDGTPPTGLGANSQSFAFAVPIPKHAFSFTLACHTMPLQIPRFSFGKTPPPVSAPPPERNILQRLSRLMRSVEAYANKVGGVLDPVEDIRDDVYLLNELYGQFSSKRVATRVQGARLVASWAIEGGMDLACTQPGKQAFVARAVAWNEKTKTLKKAGLGQ